MNIDLPTAAELHAWLREQYPTTSLGIARSMGSGPTRAFMEARYPGSNFETGCRFDPDDEDDDWYLHYGFRGDAGTVDLPHELAAWEVAFNKCRPISPDGVFDQDTAITVKELLMQVDGAVNAPA